MLIDALILAGGRSSRLDSVPKARLGYRERTLLENTVAAVRGLRSVVVVGDVTGQSLPAEVLVTREEPAFAGPAAAIGAGLDRLRAAHPVASDVIVVLACDLPRVEAAVSLLLGGLGGHDLAGDGLIAVDSAHRLQPLLAAYRTEALASAVASEREAGTLDGLAVFQLIRAFELRELAVPDDATADVDTWDDAARWGIERPAHSHTDFHAIPMRRSKKMADEGEHGAQDEHRAGDEQRAQDEQRTRDKQRAQEDEALRQWCARVAEATGVPGLEVDLKTVLGLAGRAAHAVMRPAAPLTTFVVGYAAGVAAASGKASAAEAFTAAADAGFQLCRETMNSASADA